MVVKLLVVWFLAVVAFFVLWAVLVKVVKRVNEKKNNIEEPAQQEESLEKSASADQPS